jgi:protein-disulfide isomerase
MENGEKNVEGWVNEHLVHLEPTAGWAPEAERGLALLPVLDRAIRARRRRWGVTMAAGIALAGSLFVIPGCQAATCKVRSDTLAERLWKSVFREERPTPRPGPAAPGAPAASSPLPAPAATASAARPSPPAPPAVRGPGGAAKNYKLTGSPFALVLCEIFTDYECPACARLYSEMVPRLRADYVATGKVRLLHRDYPLPRHAHARLAAHYANAAGLTGQYEVAVEQLFRTQSAWALTGDIDSQLTQVLSAEVMSKVRDLVHSDSLLNQTLETDVAQGRADQLIRTPAIVLVVRGERRVLPYLDYRQLKATLDELVTR